MDKDGPIGHYDGENHLGIHGCPIGPPGEEGVQGKTGLPETFDKPVDRVTVYSREIMKTTFHPILGRGLRRTVYFHDYQQLVGALKSIQEVLPDGYATRIEIKFFDVSKDEHCRQMMDVRNKNEKDKNVENVPSPIQDAGDKV
jgi:hypothetical protein